MVMFLNSCHLHHCSALLVLLLEYPLDRLHLHLLLLLVLLMVVVPLKAAQ